MSMFSDFSYIYRPLFTKQILQMKWTFIKSFKKNSLIKISYLILVGLPVTLEIMAPSEIPTESALVPDAYFLAAYAY